MENANPQIFQSSTTKRIETDENIEDPIDAQEVFDLIRNINDPEHPVQEILN